MTYQHKMYMKMFDVVNNINIREWWENGGKMQGKFMYQTILIYQKSYF